MFIDKHRTIIKLGDWVAYDDIDIGSGEGEVTGFDNEHNKLIIDGIYAVKSNNCYNLQDL